MTLTAEVGTRWSASLCSMLIWRTSDCPLPMSPLPMASNGSRYSKPSGVHEPEVVPELVREHPHRVVAVDPDVMPADLGDPGERARRPLREDEDVVLVEGVVDLRPRLRGGRPALQVGAVARLRRVHDVEGAEHLAREPELAVGLLEVIRVEG